MIATIKGKLSQLATGYGVVEVAGVGFQVQLSEQTRKALPPVGEDVFLHTYLQFKEEAVQLFGFATAEEKSLFLLLISLPKVGVRTARDILSTYSVNDFRKIVLQQDIARLTQVPGVGRKTAERMLFELKERLEKLPEASVREKPADVDVDIFEQAVQGLIYLGVKYSTAVAAVRQAVESGEEETGVEELIRESLKYTS